MDAILGLLGLVVFSACIIALAAATTWAVVRLSPARSTADSKPDS